MATHAPTFELVVTDFIGKSCPDPLDAAAKATLIGDTETTVKSTFNANGHTDAENSLVATINDPEATGPDGIVMWLDYEQPVGTPYRCRVALSPGIEMLAGADQSF